MTPLRMKPISRLIWGLLAAVALQAPAQAAQAPTVANAPAGAVRVMATAAIRGPLDAVVVQAEQAIGKPIVIQYGSARGGLKDEILAGQDFEVALLLPDVDDQLRRAGKIKPGSWEIARAPIGIGIRGEPAVRIDVSTAANLRQALLKAKAVKYAPTGAALMTVRKVLSTLHVADTITDVSALPGAAVLQPGEYEINFYPLSEIIANKSLKNMGLVPPALQEPAIVTATIGANTRDEAAARALVAFLRGPAIDPALQPNGMTKGRR